MKPPAGPDWLAYRHRLRTRRKAYATFVLGPWILLVVALRIFGEHGYPPGDIRNEPMFWAAIGIAALALVGYLTLSAVRALRETD